MGYHTAFIGSFVIEPPLSARLAREIEDFVDKDHRNDKDPGIRAFDGIWCPWTIGHEGDLVAEGEKPYNYIEWLRYLIKKFLAPNGHTLLGEVEWEGEENADAGKMVAITLETLPPQTEIRVYRYERTLVEDTDPDATGGA